MIKLFIVVVIVVVIFSGCVNNNIFLGDIFSSF